MRTADRCKATSLYHQFASGVYRHFLHAPLPYELDANALQSALNEVAKVPLDMRAGVIDHLDRTLDAATRELLAADQRIAPSLMRRVFETLKRQDESILHYLVKFYLYADAVEADHRDKVDYLFTRIGEEWTEPLELRERILALVSVLRVAPAPREEVIPLIRVIRRMRAEVQAAGTFDALTEGHLLRNTRTLKHRVGDLYFDPDVLVAILELNIVTKQRFLELYTAEERRILDDSGKLMAHGSAIERNFGDTNPELVEEIARFRALRETFDSLRAQSNVKHDVVARLKASMSNILTQLDRGVNMDAEPPPAPVADLPPKFFEPELVAERFGREEPLLPFLLRIAQAVEASSERDLRLETWEAEAYQKLFGARAADADEDETLWTLFLRAAALRVKVDEEATILATALAAGVRPEPDLLPKAKQSLDSAKALDEQFNDMLQEAAHFTNARLLHQLYRSRFRLLRGFSGLWLIYDRA